VERSGLPETPFARPSSDVATALAVDVRRGLSAAEVERRRGTFGANMVVRDANRSLWAIAIRQFRSIIVVLLAAAAAIAFATRDAAEGAAILGVLLINAAVGFVVEWRSERALESLRIQVRTTARVLRDGAQSIIDAEELVPGDVILLDPGAHIPADARLVEAMALRVEEAALTGESAPVTKSVESVAKDTPLAERTCTVFLGTIVTAGRATAIVTATGDATELGKIGRLVRDIEKQPTPLEQRLAALGRTLVWIVLAIGAVITVAGVVRGDPLWQMVEVGISLAVAAVPEGLPAVTTLILSVGVLRMARRHAIVRKLPAVETLGGTTVICTDKTGTLTMNQLTVREIDAVDPTALLRIGVLCSDAVITDGKPVGDPTEVALVVAAMDAGLDVAALRAAYRKIRESPFDPATRRMITVHESLPDGSSCCPSPRVERGEGGRRPGEGTRHEPGTTPLAHSPRLAALKGAPSVVLAMCTDLTPERRAELAARNEQLAARGLRVLAFASGSDDSDLTSGYTFAGFAALADPPRPAAAEAIASARDAGVRVVMLTGDQVETARAIARELRLSGDRPPVVVHARELDGSNEAAVTRLARESDVFARITPEDKLRVVDALRNAGEIVAVTGDGVNDAPALRRADIGVAMGKSGTDAAKQTADLILTDDNLGTIVVAIEEGRTIYANIAKFVHLLFSHNLGEVIMVFTAILVGLPLPLLPLQILWMNVVTDTFPAFALALEPSQARRMHGRRERGDILSRSFLLLVGWQGALLAAIALVAYLWALHLYGEGPHARTVALLSLVAVQVGHTFNCRSRIASAATGLFDNLHIWAALATVVALQALALTFRPLAHLLDLTPVTSTDLLVTAASVVLPIVVVETQKAFARARLD
jgi:Ca2+-transporting ATPase